MTNRRPVVVAVLIVLVIAAGASYLFWDQLLEVGGLTVNVARSSGAPPGTLTIETASGAQGVRPPAPGPSSATPLPAASLDWPSYNRTLTSDRHSPLAQINRDNANQLRVSCTYDTKEYTSFETGPIVVGNALIGTTEHDIFSIDAATCRENWRTHEDYVPSQILRVNRGAAYWEGLLFRGTEDGRMLAYDFKTGTRVWQAELGDTQLGESTPAAPIAWNGLVFIGNAGGDNKGVKGRMYALDAKTGRIVWEFYLVPKGPDDPIRGPQGATPLDASSWRNRGSTPITGGATWTSYTLDPVTGELYVPGGNPAPDFASGPREGSNLYSGSVVVLDAATGAYKRHFKLVPKDWHDWDVSNTPAYIHTRDGKRLLAVTPKDGHLYGFDLDSNALLYRMPVTRIENADATFSPATMVHFCPGTLGGAEWNGPSYDPQTNLILVGEVDWCANVKLQTDSQIRASARGKPWSGMDSKDPYDVFGHMDPHGQWGGWLYASDADTGAWTWRARSNYPIQSGVTTTAGGLAFFGDMGGNFYALDTATGRRRWGKNLGSGGIGGGVITYSVGGAQKVAIAVGFTNIVWPTTVATGKILVLGLPSG
jgi:alcohol dehydrogenase (cytochrome c)